MRSDPQATFESLSQRLPSAEGRSISARRQVINIGDRVFYMVKGKSIRHLKELPPSV